MPLLRMYEKALKPAKWVAGTARSAARTLPPFRRRKAKERGGGGFVGSPDQLLSLDLAHHQLIGSASSVIHPSLCFRVLLLLFLFLRLQSSMSP